MFNQEGNNINYYCQIEKKETLGISSLHSLASLYKTAYKKGGRCIKSQPLSRQCPQSPGSTAQPIRTARLLSSTVQEDKLQFNLLNLRGLPSRSSNLPLPIF